MGDNTGISWTDTTWNPVRGCSRVSSGCQRCYAEVQAARIVRMGKGKPTAYDGLVRVSDTTKVHRRDRADGSIDLTKVTETKARWTGKVVLDADKLADPLRWRKPRRIFVNSMSDLFHESLTNEQIAAVFGVMAACPQHTFQVLTKRARRMREWFAWVERSGERALNAMAGSGNGGAEDWRTRQVCSQHAERLIQLYNLGGGIEWPLPNVWLGVSVENQAAADERIPDLLATPAAVRFLSCEPSLGPVDIVRWIGVPDVEDQDGGGVRARGAEEPDRDRRDGSNLASRGSLWLGRVDPDSRGSIGSKRLPEHPGHGRRTPDDRLVASHGVVGDQRADTTGHDHQPQERVQVGQLAEQPRVGDRQRADAARDARPEAWEGGESGRRAKSVREADGHASRGDPTGEVDWTNLFGDRGEVRGHVPASVADRARSESIDWVICGCESGPGARPCDVAWLRSLRDQCASAAVPFFLKQAQAQNLDREVEDGNGGYFDPIAAGDGSRRKPGGVIELPYLDGVQHAAFPEVKS